jgi:hypothetical protein
MKLEKLIKERLVELDKKEQFERNEYLKRGNISFKNRFEKSARSIHEAKELNKTILKSMNISNDGITGKRRTLHEAAPSSLTF